MEKAGCQLANLIWLIFISSGSKSCQRAAHDCTDLLREGNTLSGVYSIHVPGTETVIPVYCDMETDGGGWLVNTQPYSLFTK